MSAAATCRKPSSPSVKASLSIVNRRPFAFRRPLLTPTGSDAVEEVGEAVEVALEGQLDRLHAERVTDGPPGTIDLNVIPVSLAIRLSSSRTPEMSMSLGIAFESRNRSAARIGWRSSAWSFATRAALIWSSIAAISTSSSARGNAGVRRAGTSRPRRGSVRSRRRFRPRRPATPCAGSRSRRRPRCANVGPDRERDHVAADQLRAKAALEPDVLEARRRVG